MHPQGISLKQNKTYCKEVASRKDSVKLRAASLFSATLAVNEADSHCKNKNTD